MNDFLDSLGKTVNKTAKKAMKASGNMVELTKTLLNIKFEEVKRESFFREIGKIVYGNYKKSPESQAGEILDFCECIDEVEVSIKSQKAKAAKIKNKKFCVDCGTVLAKSVNFCYSCGAKQPEIIEEEDEPEESGCCCCEDEPKEAECCEDADCCCEGSEEAECCEDECCSDECCSDEACDCGSETEETE
ncbi:MAG: hypothetical protein FWH48_08050 [Oscillospiraceae bacterium]|nr:hypothetical protein [Oscillospiraceae bacterium]